MPLRARLYGEDIFSFNYDEKSWLDLKKYPVSMHCCESKAILKKSKLGTLFFAHSTKGTCTSRGESPEHLYIKNLISKAAIQLGWNAYSEEQGETPEGEKWVADVFCSTGNVKLVFEIQWSPQSLDEFIRRQKKYNSSGIRAAWLYRLKRNKEYSKYDIPYNHDVPVFGLKSHSPKVEDLFIPQFNLSIESFIKGMLQGKLSWSPKQGQQLIAEIIPHYEYCWRCKKETGIIIGISIKDNNGTEFAFKSFTTKGIPEFIIKNLNKDILSNYKIGIIKERYSKTINKKYISNGCFHCDSLMGNHFIIDKISENIDSFQTTIQKINFIFDNNIFNIKSDWYFDGKRAKYSF